MKRTPQASLSPERDLADKSVDWLRLQRARREESGNSGKRRRGLQEWEKELKDNALAHADKVELIKGKAKQLEESARRREQLARLQQSEMTMSEQNEINDIYIESIKAKLAVLKNI